MVSLPVPMEVDSQSDRLAPSIAAADNGGILQTPNTSDDVADDRQAQSDIIRGTERANFPLSTGAAQYLISTR